MTIVKELYITSYFLTSGRNGFVGAYLNNGMKGAAPVACVARDDVNMEMVYSLAAVFSVVNPNSKSRGREGGFGGDSKLLYDRKERSNEGFGEDFKSLGVDFGDD
jgi:hypothetical protein